MVILKGWVFLMSEVPLYSLDGGMLGGHVSVRLLKPFLVDGFGCGVYGSECRVEGVGFGVQGSGLRAEQRSVTTERGHAHQPPSLGPP